MRAAWALTVLLTCLCAAAGEFVAGNEGFLRLMHKDHRQKQQPVVLWPARGLLSNAQPTISFHVRIIEDAEEGP